MEQAHPLSIEHVSQQQQIHNIVRSMKNLDAKLPTQDRFIQSRNDLQNLSDVFKIIPQKNDASIFFEKSHPNKIVLNLIQGNAFARKKLPRTFNDFDNLLLGRHKSAKAKVIRKIEKKPFKILDAPELEDDYYFNVLDWNDRNFIGIGLAHSLYTWQYETGKVSKVV